MGTSFAASQVTGAAALMFAARPELTAAQARDCLVRSTEQGRPLAGVLFDEFNLEAALNCATGGPPLDQPIPIATTRVSVSSDGEPGNRESRNSVISADGRYVAFNSEASNLVPDDTNDASDVFVHDRDTGETSRVSVSSDGDQADGPSFVPAVSAHGRYVAFLSRASNLVPDDTNDVPGVFVHDRDTGETSRVSVSSDGEQANDRSSSPAISADGRYVAFRSDASNLVPGHPNDRGDVFVHDRDTGETSRVSVSLRGRANLGLGTAPN